MPEKRILLVDDEASTSQLLANVLRVEGYAVDAAATFAEAMGCLDKTSYALVIADWRLPDGDGFIVAETAAARGAKTLLMSGYLFQMPQGTAGRYETLMKPLRPSEIVAAVERSIGGAGVSRA